jgi:hypothetical protein
VASVNSGDAEAGQAVELDGTPTLLVAGYSARQLDIGGQGSSFFFAARSRYS